MARRTRKAPKQPVTEHIPETIFESMDAANPDKRMEQKASEPTTADLLAQLAQMSERLDNAEREAAMERARSTPSMPVPQVQQVQLEQPKLDMTGLPDPVTQAEAYGQEVARRTIQYQNDMRDYASKQKEAATPQPMGDPDALFEDFGEAFPDYAAENDKMSFIASQVAKRLSKRGVDVQKYMYRQSDRFFKDLVKEYDKVFGKPGEEGDEDDEAVVLQEASKRVTRRNRNSQTEDDENANEGRDAMIPGGSGPFGAGGPQITRAPAGDMIRDIHDMQRKSGYF